MVNIKLEKITLGTLSVTNERNPYERYNSYNANIEMMVYNLTKVVLKFVYLYKLIP